ERGRIADGRGDEYASGPVQGGDHEGAVRGRDQYDARCVAAADGARVRGVGQSEWEGGVRLHVFVFAIRSATGEELSADTGEDELQRQPGDVLGTGEVRRETADAKDRQKRLRPEDEHGGGTRRVVGAVRQLARHGVRLCVHAVAGRGVEVGSVCETPSFAR